MENQIIENTVEEGEWGDRIYIRGDNNIIRDNTLSNSQIYISGGEENTVQGNILEGELSTIALFSADTNLIKQNRIIQGTQHGIKLDNSSFNNIEDNNITDTDHYGIYIYDDSHSNVIAFNHIWGSFAGIVIYGDGNGVHENISESCGSGIIVETEAANSWVYNNLFRNNNRNAVDDGTNTTWNKPKTPVASNIVGGPYLGGNYWDDYTGVDSDGDKLGDTPYPISGDAAASDNLPLIWVSMPTPTPPPSVTPTPEGYKTPTPTPTAQPTPAVPTPTPPGYGYGIIDSGDYNGDGTDDIAIFRQSSGLWSVRGVTRVYFGGSDDIPTSGDYDGDGTTDVALFRGSSGLWAVRTVTRVYFGASSDIAAPGDYDGNGCCDVGIFRDASGLWALRTSGDIPVTR